MDLGGTGETGVFVCDESVDFPLSRFPVVSIATSGVVWI